jgi:hypothetical protein
MHHVRDIANYLIELRKGGGSQPIVFMGSLGIEPRRTFAV